MTISPTYSMLLLCAGCLSSPTESSTDQESRGAVFTTGADGSDVNDNIYAAKEDVYLDGGPGPNAKPGAAALPEGDYYFQVTDPSGKTLLSSDAIECRRFHIGAAGFIDAVIRTGCEHATAVDSDQGAQGAITVQLFPYADTPNNGGEYKVWVVAVESSTAAKPFPHKYSKTDNFKVRTSTPPPPPPDDDDCDSDCDECPPPPPAPVCGDGHLDTGEECDDGNTSGGDGCDGTCKVEHSCPTHC
jgi:cysteine-rich repeat protein